MAENVEKAKNEAHNFAGESKERDDRACQEVTDGCTRILNSRTYLENKWIVLDRMWRGDPVTRYYSSKTGTHIPEPYKLVQAAVPRVKMGIFPNDDWYRLIPDRPGASDPGWTKKLLQEQLRHGRFDARRTTLIQMAAKYGTAFAKVPFVYDRQEMVMNERGERVVYKDGEPVEVEKGGVKTRTFTRNKDRTELRPLSIFDVAFDWRYETVYDAPWVADVSKQSKEYGLQMIAKGIWQNITAADLDEIVAGREKVGQESIGQSLQQQATGAGDMPRKPEDDLRVTDWWGLFDIEGAGEREECNLTTVGKHVVVIRRNNLWHGYRPYLHAKWVSVEGEGYGIGLIEPVTRLCLDLNDMQNTVNAASAIIANPAVKAGDRMDIPDEQVFISPGRVFRGEDITQLQPFYIPDVTGVARMTGTELRRDIQEGAGVPSLYHGTETGREETATGVATRVKEANMRLRDVILYLAPNTFEPFIEMCVFNNQQFLKEDRVVTYSGDANLYRQFKVTPDKLAGIARVEVVLTPQIELLGVREMQMERFMRLLQNMQVGVDPTVVQRMLKKIWIYAFGYEDYADIWPPDLDKPKETQREEILRMSEGFEIDVLPMHNHLQHMLELTAYFDTMQFKRLKAERKAILEGHFATHDMYARQQQEQGGAVPGFIAPMGYQESPAGAPAPALAGQAAGRQLGRAAQAGVQGR